jgi:Mg-chelatase subunit ChlD
VAPGGEPVGLALDEQKGRLFIGCRKPQKMVVMSTSDGKVLASLPIGAGVDATKFDNGQAFASCRDGSLVVVTEKSPGQFEVAQMVKTPEGARTMGIDSSTHTIYLPTAEFEPANPGQRPKTKPGTFMIVAVAQLGGH